MALLLYSNSRLHFSLLEALMLRRGQLFERKNYSGQHCGIESRTYRDNVRIYLAVSVKSYTHSFGLMI